MFHTGIIGSPTKTITTFFNDIQLDAAVRLSLDDKEQDQLDKLAYQLDKIAYQMFCAKDSNEKETVLVMLREKAQKKFMERIKKIKAWTENSTFNESTLAQKYVWRTLDRFFVDRVAQMLHYHKKGIMDVYSQFCIASKLSKMLDIAPETNLTALDFSFKYLGLCMVYLKQQEEWSGIQLIDFINPEFNLAQFLTAINPKWAQLETLIKCELQVIQALDYNISPHRDNDFRTISAGLKSARDMAALKKDLGMKDELVSQSKQALFSCNTNNVNKATATDSLLSNQKDDKNKVDVAAPVI